VGPLTRTVEDAALIWEALGGPRTDLSGASVQGATFGILRTMALDDLEEAPARAFDAALDRLARTGARLVDIRLPRLPRAFEVGVPLYTAEAWTSWREHVEPAPDKVFAPTLDRVSAGRNVLAADYLAFMAELRAIRAEARDALGGLDALLCPTVPILPPQAAAVAADHELFRTRNLLASRNARMANLLGLASVSVPTGTPSCGLMLSVLPGREGQVLRTAQATLRSWA
jgi:aspartyl-tRNA(Asn)/glutamyl-tRNA(Gln) amidotransferase subunit A